MIDTTIRKRRVWGCTDGVHLTPSGTGNEQHHVSVPCHETCPHRKVDASIAKCLLTWQHMYVTTNNQPYFWYIKEKHKTPGIPRWIYWKLFWFSGIELIFFLVPRTVLCFRFSMRVDNRLMFRLLLSSAYSKSRTLQCLMLCRGAGAQEAQREHSQERWPELDKGIFHTTGCMPSI